MARWFIGIALLGCAVIWAIPGGAADPSDKKSALDEADVKAMMEYNLSIS